MCQHTNLSHSISELSVVIAELGVVMAELGVVMAELASPMASLHFGQNSLPYAWYGKACFMCEMTMLYHPYISRSTLAMLSSLDVSWHAKTKTIGDTSASSYASCHTIMSR